MATGNHKKTMRAEEVTAFGGLDASSPHGGGHIAYDMKNFKILSDGSLVKRDGFSILTTLSDNIRGLYVLHETAGDFILAVVGAWLYRISVADGTYECAEVLTTVSGRACFFGYGGELYLMDGTEIYHYTGGLCLVECLGYIPLYGKDWIAVRSDNVVNEPINLLSRKIRYTCSHTTSFSMAYLGLKISSIDRVLHNGVEIASSRYYVNDTGLSVNFTSSFSSSSKLELCVTLDDSYWHDALLRSCTYAAQYDSISNPRVFLYGGEEGSSLYLSRPVDAESLAASLEVDESSTALYFPKDKAVSFDERQTVTAMERAGNRMIICTANETWITGDLNELAAGEESKLTVGSLSQTVGCRSQGGIALIEGDTPVTLSAGGIYRWDIDLNMERGCTSKRISDGIAMYLDDGFFSNARMCYVRATDELWFYLPGDEDGRVFIYNCASKLWYSYIGVCASELFDVGDRVGFSNGADVFLFDSTRTTDLCSFGEREIVGTFESRRTDFGDSEAKKRAVRLYVEADAADGELTVGLRDGGLLDEVTFVGTGEGAVCYSSRVNTSRFRRLSVTLRATGAERQRIYGFCIHIAT